MRNLSPDQFSPAQVLRALRYLWKRANAHPKLKALAAAVKKAYDQLKVQCDHLEDAELDVEGGTALIEVANDDLGAAFRPLVRGLDQLVDGSPSDPRRRRLFKKTPSEALAGTVGVEQAEFVQGVLQTLAKDADFKTLQLHGKGIEAAWGALKVEIQSRDQSKAALAVAQSAHKKALHAACEVHNGAEPDIKKVVGSNRRKVDSYFLRLRAKRTKQPEPA